MNSIHGPDHPTKGNGLYKAVCHWCGEKAVETIKLSEYPERETGYVDEIDICHDPECIERTKKVIKFKREYNG